MSQVENIEVEVSEEVEKVSAAPARLCKGAMPMPLVHYIKFNEPKEAVSEVARKYFTTPGKISDIQKGANQKYIVEGMKFSKEELDDAADKIRENFTRGQDENGVALDPDNKRGTATTTAEDAEYALSVLQIMRDTEYDDNALTLEAARAKYNEKNPRPPRAKKANTDTVEADVETLDSEEVGDFEDEDDLLDM